MNYTHNSYEYETKILTSEQVQLNHTQITTLKLKWKINQYLYQFLWTLNMCKSFTRNPDKYHTFIHIIMIFLYFVCAIDSYTPQESNRIHLYDLL